MESLFEKQINEILESNDKHKIENDLTKLLKESNKDHYVMAILAQFRYENGFGGYTDFLKELQQDDDYFVFATYYLGSSYFKKERYEESVEELGKILHYDGTYPERARYIYPEALFRNKEYDVILDFFEYLKDVDLLNDAIYFYVGKVYYDQHNLKKAKEYVEQAVSINPEESKYHAFLRIIYQDTKDIESALKEIQILKSMDIDQSLRDKLALVEPTLCEQAGKSGQAFQLMKHNIENGITNKNQELAYFKLAAKYGDYNTADELSRKLINSQSFGRPHYKSLIYAYQDENLCDKIMKLYSKKLANQNDYEIIFIKATTLIQMGKIGAAKEELLKIINVCNNPYYIRTYILCLYLEGNIDKAKELLKKNPPIDNKLDIYLRYKLGMLDYKNVKNASEYAKLIDQYDFEMVYRDAKSKLCSFVRPSGLNAGVNPKRFIGEMNEIISDLQPNYRYGLVTDEYLIDYGKNIAYVNGVQTSHFKVGAIPDGKLLSIKPVIPSNDGRPNYQRVR